MNIDEILDLMDGLLDKSSSVPFSNKRMIDCEQMREYIDTIRLNFPTELKKAKDMARDKEKIIAEANKNAEEIIKKAEERAKILVSEQEIIKEAGEIANDQLKRAKEQADQIIADAVAKDRDIKSALASNLNKVLSEAERVLNRNLNEVTNIKEAVIKIGSAE
ncbi:MAG: vacuolar-type H+-ATPase subunit H [Ruminococcus sp.]|nr:vacuolar-type H+-ATPase subunit H [Ruminococcus sp.]